VAHASTRAPAAPSQLSDWDAAARARMSDATAAGREAGAALGVGRPQDFRPACCQSSWDVDGRVLYTAGALWEDQDTAPLGDQSGGFLDGGGSSGGGGYGSGGGAGGGGLAVGAAGQLLVVDGLAAERPLPRQVPTVAAVCLQQTLRPAGCGGSSSGSSGGSSVRHVMTSHHASAIFQDRLSGSLLVGTGTPLLLHIS
jgi:hypothetical protein